MKSITRTVAGMVAAAVVATSFVAPADARRYGRWHHRDRVDAGDVLAGIAIIGGLAAIASAVSRDRGYRTVRDDNPYRAVVNSCGYEADEAYGEGNVRVTDVEQLDEDVYRVSGEVERGGGYYGRVTGEDESSAVIGEEPERYYDSEARRRERELRERFTFTCIAEGDGRITEFAVNE